jgi:signal transduction histidine kinase
MSTYTEPFVSSAARAPRRSVSAFKALAFVVLAYAAILPFAALPLPRSPTFVSTLEGMICLADVLTAAFLYSQFWMTRSRAMLMLASGYSFTALLVVVHLSTFPLVFSPTGLLGTGPQGTGWLFITWHLGFSVAVCLYVVLKDADNTENPVRQPPARAICLSLLTVSCMVILLTLLLTAAREHLPKLVLDGLWFSPLGHFATGVDLVIAMVALLLLAIRQTSMLDRWLMVSLCALVAELTLISFVVHGRYDLGFYAERAFALVSSAAVLAALHAEVAGGYSRAVHRLTTLRHERESRLVSIQGAAGAIAHEIKQPMAAIALEADTAREYLGRTPPDIEEVRESLAAIASNAVRASEVITNIRSALKSDSVEMVPLKLNDIITEALNRMREEFDARAVRVELSLAAELPAVRGHRGQLLQVFLNLLANAIDALENVTSGGRLIRIESAPLSTDRIVVRVEDSGSGIDPRIAGGIFDLFATTKPSGMGLGLTLCRLIIEQHGGEIVASSPAGPRFQVFLPTAQ